MPLKVSGQVIDRRDTSTAVPVPRVTLPGVGWGGIGLRKGVPLGRDTQDIDREYDLSDVAEMRRIYNAVGKGVIGTSSPVAKVNALPKVAVPKIRPRVLPTIDRRPALSTKSPIPVKTIAERRPTATPSSTTILQTIKEKPVGLDLGNILGTGLDLFERYQGLKGPTRVSAPAPVTQWGGAGYGAEMINSPTLIDSPFGIPGVEVIGEENLDKGMVYKKVCGQYKWVKQKHRRRRKLLTDADYNGLLKLQTLKNNANMNIAIAKALGR